MDLPIGAGAAFAIALVTTPVGVSGAVFLIPVQVSVLETPNPTVTPTNLFYNLIATPGALARYGRDRVAASRLARPLVLGTLPGVVAGAVIRVTLVDGPDAFLVVIAVVLIPLGLVLAAGTPPKLEDGSRPSERALTLLGLAVGAVGGIYGIGGGSILGPILVAAGISIYEVAPAALAATFLTSIAGVAAFALLSVVAAGAVAPEWDLGLAIGVGGLAGGWCGAALQPRLPEALLRRGLGLIALALGVRYAVLAV
jgi:uncharacterized membrane protein YfcA